MRRALLFAPPHLLQETYEVKIPHGNELREYKEKRNRTPVEGRHRCRMNAEAAAACAFRDAWELAKHLGYEALGEPMIWAEDDQVFGYRFHHERSGKLHIEWPRNPVIKTYSEAKMLVEGDPSSSVHFGTAPDEIVPAKTDACGALHPAILRVSGH